MTPPKKGDYVRDAKDKYRCGEVVKRKWVHGHKCVQIKTRGGYYLTIILTDVVVIRRVKP